MTIRLAQNTDSDMRLVFELSNDPNVRESSFNSDSIPLENHKKWYFSTISNINILFFLFFIGNDFVGQIRFICNNSESDTVEISVSINAAYRGKGIGKTMMDLAVSELQKKWPGIRAILAEVKLDNTASNNFFLKYRFLKYSTSFHSSIPCNVYKLEI